MPKILVLKMGILGKSQEEIQHATWNIVKEKLTAKQTPPQFNPHGYSIFLDHVLVEALRANFLLS